MVTKSKIKITFNARCMTSTFFTNSILMYFFLLFCFRSCETWITWNLDRPIIIVRNSVGISFRLSSNHPTL